MEIRFRKTTNETSKDRRKWSRDCLRQINWLIAKTWYLITQRCSGHFRNFRMNVTTTLQYMTLLKVVQSHCRRRLTTAGARECAESRLRKRATRFLVSTVSQLLTCTLKRGTCGAIQSVHANQQSEIQRRQHTPDYSTENNDDAARQVSRNSCHARNHTATEWVNRHNYRISNINRPTRILVLTVCFGFKFYTRKIITVKSRKNQR